MDAIHIRRTLASDTPHLPELTPFIGKTVDITLHATQSLAASHRHRGQGSD